LYQQVKVKNEQGLGWLFHMLES